MSARDRGSSQPATRRSRSRSPAWEGAAPPLSLSTVLQELTNTVKDFQVQQQPKVKLADAPKPLLQVYEDWEKDALADIQKYWAQVDLKEKYQYIDSLNEVHNNLKFMQKISWPFPDKYQAHAVPHQGLDQSFIIHVDMHRDQTF